jgi:hypothetical protein
LLLPAIQTAREAGRRAQCSSQLHQTTLALLNYEQINKIFPPGARSGGAGEGNNKQTHVPANWIILILPQMDQMALYNQFAFNSTDPAVRNACKRGTAESGYYVSDQVNAVARATEIPSLLCTSDNRNNTIHFQGAMAGEAPDWARGNVGCNAGNLYPADTSCRGEATAWSEPFYRGVMAFDKHVISLAQITDGASQTILLGEVRSGVAPTDRRGTWAMGGPGSSMACAHGSLGDDNGPNACYPEGDDIWGGGKFQTSNTPTAYEYADCMTVNNGSSQQATWRSTHTEGVNCAMADASVHFISDSVETSGMNAYRGCPGAATSIGYPDPVTGRPLGTVWDWMISSQDGQRIDAKKAGML